ncbi:MAG TPA: CPBP family intramembrane glutamic endopeptidase [Gemmatimonadaceae bacterium]|nr:CPBP family intramembrane glutamic endopeptidase [Gemmatimonadaceae bacterium]
MRSSKFAIFVVAVAVAAAAVAAWLLPRALPIVALKQSLTREVALARADSFFRAHSLAPAGARTAIRFQANESVLTFVELAGGGHDSLNALVRGDDIAPFTWLVRAFVPGDVREAQVAFAPDGRIIGFERKLAEADPRPTVSADSGQRLAEQALDSWINERANRWKLVTSSYETKKASGRIDRTYTFERVDRRIGGAPIRADVVIGGDTPVSILRHVEIPESFRRRYAEMRSANELLALIATFAFLGVAIVGMIQLSRFARERRVRWRQPIAVGAVIGALALAAGINEMPGSWFSYDTAMPPGTFLALQVLLAVVLGVFTALLLVFTLAAAEASTRQAFPRHLDWWKLWRFRGTREVASLVGGGYAVAAIAFAYVAAFYLATRTLFGWWVPSELLDNPNQIASPMPWISGIAASVNAGVWEESLFRALPLSLLSLWVGTRPTRRWWMAAGVVASALVFGFAHANYASWPPYSRGVEIFLDACFWAVLFINFGLLVTVVAHFVYDLVLFGIFAASGSTVEYRVTAAIILLALLAPALVVFWRWVRQRGFTAAPEEARFAAWTPIAAQEQAAPIPLRQVGAFTTRARRLALAAAIAAVIVAVARPPKPTLGPQFTAVRAHVIQTADSMLLAHGGNPLGWRRLTGIGRDTLSAWPRFVRKYKLVPEAQRFASTFEPSTWWVVRYVHTKGSAAQRTEEWRVRIWPDGRPLDTRHLVPDSATGNSPDTSAVRGIALATLTREGINTSTLQESELEETARPARRDVTVTYTDTTVKLPDGAAARAWVEIAGDQPLVARRGVELPETFLRADRARQTNRIAVAAISILLVLGLIVTGAIVVKRRRRILLDDGSLDRRATFILLGTLAVLWVLTSLNNLPSTFFSYSTTQPWGSFIGSTALGFLMAIPLALLVLGLWLALGAMRRRVGIPMLEGEASRATSNEMLISGLGLGGIIYAMSHLTDLIVTRGVMPRTPTTMLNTLSPVFAGVTDIPANALFGVAMVGIPILVVAALTPRWSLRAFAVGAVLALAAAVAWASGSLTDIDPVSVTLVIMGVVIVAIALVVGGTRSAWSWIVAALFFQALLGLREAAYGPVWQARGAGALTVLVASAFVALIARRTGRSHQPAGIFR